MKKLLTLFILLVTTVAASAYKLVETKVNVGGQTREVLVYTPDVVTKGMPLMIITHGMGQSPEYQRDGDKMYELIDTEKFIVAYPRADGTTWDIGGDKDLNFIKQTIEDMKTSYGIDEARIYWSGFSMGSMLIYHCMAQMADKIAAFAPTSGIQFSEQPWTALANANLKVNLIAHHSNQDSVFPIDQYDVKSYVTNIANKTGCTTYTSTNNYVSKEGDYKGLKEVWVNPTTGNEVELFMYDGGGHWPSYYNRKEIWNFCKRFSLLTPAQTYEKTYQRAVEVVDLWANDPNVNNKSTYKLLVTYLSTYSPDAVDLSNETKLKTATSKLTSGINNLETTIKTATKTSPEVQLSDFDPNFHIYLCFGQSNMEGNATPELEDYAITSDRFLTMAATDMTTHKRTMGHWYMARPPLCRDNTGLTPADYFGRELVKMLPDNVKVGVINVALGGCDIRMFDEDDIEDYISQQVGWLQGYAAAYNNNPYRRLVDMAKEAQKVGVIKGILLHQGETNNCQADWPQKVKKVYDRLIAELNLDPEDTPLLAGEMLSQKCGGVCWGHNSIIAKLPQTITNSHVVSSKDCPGASDGLHFTAEGYRMIGRNYANVMMELLRPYISQPDLDVDAIRFEADTLRLQAGASQRFNVYGSLADGSELIVNANCNISVVNPDMVSFSCPIHLTTGMDEGITPITASFVRPNGESLVATTQAMVELFCLTSGFEPSLLQSGTYTYNASKAYGTYKGVNNGMGGWQFAQGVDLSGKPYLHLQLRNMSLAKPVIRIYDSPDLSSSSYATIEVGSKKEIIADLSTLTKTDGTPLDLSHVYCVGIAVKSNSTVTIQSLTVTNEDITGIANHIITNSHTTPTRYDLSGRPATNHTKGIVVSKGMKGIK